MMPVSDGFHEHQLDYKQKYKALKKKLRLLVYEQECYLEEMRKSQRKLLKVARDRSFLLDRLLQYEKVEDSSDDSDATATSDSDADGPKEGSAKKRRFSPGRTQLPHHGDLSYLMASGGLPGLMQSSSSNQLETSKKKTKPSVKKSGKVEKLTVSKKAAGGEIGSSKPQQQPGQMTREELERHLESRQHNTFGIEKAPALLPQEIFSNDNSNQDSNDLGLGVDGDEDADLVIDMPR